MVLQKNSKRLIIIIYMQNYTIYSIEDDKQIATVINKTLSKEGYNVLTFFDAETFLEEFKINKPNMILLDLMLPKMQGMELLDLIRKEKENNNIVVIIVSAKETLEDKVNGLDCGADDYIVKPFDLSELRSRINAHVRRQNINNDVNDLINILNYKIYVRKEEVFNKNNKIELTKTEFKILLKLVLSRGKIVIRKELFDVCNLKDNASNSRTIDMHIKSLRNKLGDKDNKFIKTIYGKGYIVE